MERGEWRYKRALKSSKTVASMAFFGNTERDVTFYHFAARSLSLFLTPPSSRAHTAGIAGCPEAICGFFFGVCFNYICCCCTRLAPAVSRWLAFLGG